MATYKERQEIFNSTWYKKESLYPKEFWEDLLSVIKLATKENINLYNCWGTREEYGRAYLFTIPYVYYGVSIKC